MESLLAFQKSRADGHRLQGHKLVPWLSWQEWNFVRESLFSSSADSVAAALRRISAWQIRGWLPIVIDITAAFIRVQQQDPFFRVALISNPPHSEEMLVMLYSMAIVRLVNGVIEKTRKREEISIAESARAIGLPCELIDIRHESSHRGLPSIQLVRMASIQALEWLKSYYWEPQKNAILFQSNEAAKIREDIKCRLHELFVGLKSRQSSHSSSSPVKGKGVKRGEWLRGSSKFLSLVAGKRKSTKSGGSKKATTRAFKNLVRLYSSFPSEVVSVLFEFLNNEMNSTVLEDLSTNCQVGQNTDSKQTSIDDWKLLIGKFSKKEPKFLLSLISIVLDNMVQTREGGDHLTSAETTAKTRHVEQLSSLVVWLVESLKGLKCLHYEGPTAEGEGSVADTLMPVATLIRLLHKCLVLSAHSCRAQLMGSAMLLAQIVGNKSLFEKLNKLSLLGQTSEATEGNFSHEIFGSFLERQEDSILQAAEKLEFIKRRQEKGKTDNSTKDDSGKKNRWVVAKPWYSCPIGMLPGALGCSVLPVLGCDNDPKGAHESLEGKEHSESILCRGKREASSDIELLDTISTKKTRETVEGRVTSSEEDAQPREGKSCSLDNEDEPLEGVKGRLMIGGVWKKVGEEELLTIKSAVRILV